MTSSSRVFIFQMNEKKQLHMVTRKIPFVLWVCVLNVIFWVKTTNINHKGNYSHLKSLLLLYVKKLCNFFRESPTKKQRLKYMFYCL